MIRLFLTGFISLFLFIHLLAQDVYDARQSVMVEASVQARPPVISLRWKQDTANGGYTIWRKQKEDTQWMDSMVSVSASSTSWSDSSVVAGRAYEYQIIKSLPRFPYGNGQPNYGAGYIFSAIDLPPVHRRGSCLVVIDSSLKQGLQFEIDRLRQDLEEDGWHAQLIYVQKNESVQQVKSRIKSWSSARKDIHQALFLLGRIPVPYSGDIVPDGHHADHKGAWPCDGYYADLDGIWTDSLVNNTSAPGSRNDNKPNDGKFDQNRIPAPVRLQVGRVDFSNMSKFPETEEQLIKRYLDKDHRWRKGITYAEERALVDNNFRDIEGLGSVAWMNFTPMFGIARVKDLPYRQTLSNQSYMWSYGCGGGGPESASDISSTTNFTTDSLHTFFAMLFGSYFGDWDYPNNFLRAAIASRTCLASTWGNRPHWFLHHMALGETLGYATLATMNNRGIYTPSFYGAYANTALMGDPTLSMYNQRPVENLKLSQTGLHIELTWQDPSNSTGYYVYKRSHPDSAYRLLTPQTLKMRNFTDSCAGEGVHTYCVRSVELRTSASGTFYNLSSGLSASINCKTDLFRAAADFNHQVYFDELKLRNQSVNAHQYSWEFGDGSKSNEFEPVHLYPNSGVYEICLFASNGCETDSLCKFVQVQTSLPQVTADIEDANCFGTSTGSIRLQLTGGTAQQTITWLNRTDTGRILQNIPAGDYSCIIASETGNSAPYGPFRVSEEKKWNLNPVLTQVDPGRSNGSISLNPQGGCPPYDYRWNTGQTTSQINQLNPGTYCVTIQDCKNCRHMDCFEIKQVNSLDPGKETGSWRLFPNPAHTHLYIEPDCDLVRDFEVYIVNPLGKILSRNRMSCTPQKMSLDIRALPDGNYWIHIINEKTRVHLPFTKATD